MSNIVEAIMGEFHLKPDVAVAKMNKHLRNVEERAHNAAMAAAFDKSLEWFERYGQDKATEMIVERVTLHRTTRQTMYVDERSKPTNGKTRVNE